MDKMKKYIRWVIIIFLFYIISNAVSYKILEADYKIKEVKIPFNSPKIEITKSDFSPVDGVIAGKITNNTKEKYDDKLLKIEYFSNNNTNVGTDYIEIKDLAPGDSMEFEHRHHYQRVNTVNLSVIDMPKVEVLNPDGTTSIKDLRDVKNLKDIKNIDVKDLKQLNDIKDYFSRIHINIDGKKTVSEIGGIHWMKDGKILGIPVWAYLVGLVWIYG